MLWWRKGHHSHFLGDTGLVHNLFWKFCKLWRENLITGIRDQWSRSSEETFPQLQYLVGERIKLHPPPPPPNLRAEGGGGSESITIILQECDGCILNVTDDGKPPHHYSLDDDSVINSILSCWPKGLFTNFIILTTTGHSVPPKFK